jgi:hypothetical protein
MPTKTGKVTKGDKLIELLAKNPNASAKTLARKLGSTADSIYTMKNRYRAQIAAAREEYLRTAKKVAKGAKAVIESQLELDLSEFPIIKDHIPTEEIERLVMKPKKADRVSVDDVVNERGATYGKFENLAEVSQRFKDSLHYFLITRNKYLAPDQQEAMELIFHKFARIVNGDPDHIDNWKDVAGYATLVADRLEGNPR